MPKRGNGRRRDPTDEGGVHEVVEMHVHSPGPGVPEELLAHVNG